MARPRQTDDNALLARAMPLFWRQGFGATGLRELEAALGPKAPAIYHRFGSKEGLFQQVLAYYLEAVVGQRTRRYLQAEAPLAGLRRFFETPYDDAAADLPPLSCLLVNTATELGENEALVGDYLRRGSAMI